MKLLRQSRLFYQGGHSDKVYEVDLAELDDDRCVVNFRYGRRGTTLREGTKTTAPVSRDKAEQVFDRLVEAKRKKGYRSEGEPAPEAEQQEPADAGANSDAIPVLLKRLESTQPAGDRKKKRWRRKAAEPPLERTVWRLGERRARAAVAPLARLARDVLAAGQDDASTNLRYCLAWALGRIGDPAAADVVDQLSRDEEEAVRRIASEAMRALLPTEARSKYVDSVVDHLPSELAAAVRSGDTDGTWHALEEVVSAAGRDPAPLVVIEQLYLVDSYPAARSAVLRWSRVAPFTPPFFRRLRHLYKAAEFRRDPELFGLLAHRIETEDYGVYNHGYSNSTYFDGRWIQVSEELAKDRPRRAFSSRTKDYLRLRSARTLRRLGELGDPDFVDMAVGVLLEFRDEHAQRVRESERYYWSQRSTIRVVYPAWSAYLAFNLVLHRHSPRFELRPPGRYWSLREGQTVDATVPAIREEAFPSLWDRRPEALVHLLLHSCCAPVHDFAARALRSHEDALGRLELGQLLGLLQAPYEPTQRLGLDEARRRHQPDEPDLDLVRALFDCGLAEARGVAAEWIAARPQSYLVELDFIIHLLFHPHADVRAAGRSSVLDNTLPPQVSRQALFGRLVAELLALKPDEAEPSEPVVDRSEDVAREVVAFVAQAFHELLHVVGLDVVRELLAHSVTEVQELGARALVDHEIPAEELPAELFETLLDSPAEPIRALAVQLIGRLPEERITEREELILSFCVAESAAVRQAARPILARLAPAHPSFASAVAAALAVRLMRKERHDGLYADLVAMVSEDLRPAMDSLSAELTYRLLRSGSSGAHRLGARLLAHSVSLSDLSVRKMALLARHEMKDVRDAVWQRLGADLERTRSHLADALLALDGPWPDSREQGFVFFREHFDAEDWTPQLLVSLCDSVRDDVRQFGRDLIQRFFVADNGPEYLLKLSQHPAADVQLFATHYLERFAAGRPDRIAELTTYFTTVLSAVYRGRVAKDRIFGFLREQAVDRDTAEIVLPLLERISLTVALGDRSTVVEILNEIRRTHLDLPSLLRPRPAELRPPRRQTNAAAPGAA
ncbi:MAG: WGR domain-containing protein [Thermoanaerobaculia bacterium]|nr:WGR domain-containing protein [Thermoanaerobaculia bacterium]